jgi:hypothetical protein
MRVVEHEFEPLDFDKFNLETRLELVESNPTVVTIRKDNAHAQWTTKCTA